jgi:anti-sigma B factor antagonist
MIETPNSEPRAAPERDAGEDAALRCEVFSSEHRAVLEVSGEVDVATAPLLHREACATLEPPIQGLVLHLGSISFMDSSGLRAMTRIHAAASERHISFALTAVPPCVQRILQVTNMDEFFDIR